MRQKCSITYTHFEVRRCSGFAHGVGSSKVYIFFLPKDVGFSGRVRVDVFIAPRVTWTGGSTAINNNRLGCDTIYGAKLAKLDYDTALNKLRGSANSLRCTEVRAILTALGFKVRDGKKGNHKTFTHPSISNFPGSNFDCGHGKDAQVKKAYINNIIEVLERLESDIRTHLNKGH